MTSACLVSQPEPAGSAPPPLGPAGESSGLNEPTASGRDGATDIDDELLARIAADDESAFRQLVERHIDRAYGLAVRILNNGADAEDVVQDALLKVWTQRGRWEGGRAKFSTWLYRVVTNRCIDLRRRPRSEDVESVPEPIDERPDAVTAMQRHEVGDMLEAAMQKLPDQQRVSVILSYHDGLSNSEIAKVMETTVPAVESLLKRGRQRLKQLLRQAEGDIRQSLAND